MIRRLAVLVLWVAAAGAATMHLVNHPAVTTFAPLGAASTGLATEARREVRFVTTAATRSHTHAASLVELKDGAVRAVWFSGIREGGSDVTIQSSVFTPTSGQWGEERTLATRAATEQAVLRGTRKLGNPVISRHSDDKLWLFYVSVAFGGWAGSSVNAMASDDEGQTWSLPRRLITSPFFNLSTLVRTNPVLAADGTMLLPVYHQFFGKFSEILRIDRTGAVIDKQRLSRGRDMQQPVLMPLSPTAALILMRTASASLPDRVSATRTTDRGAHWSVPAPINLPNPDSALAGIALRDGRLLVVLNDSESDRDVLSLVVSIDGGHTWKIIERLEDKRAATVFAPDPAKYAEEARAIARETSTEPSMRGDNARTQMCEGRTRCGFEFSYPALIETRSGDIHILYTWNRAAIKHVLLNRARLEQLLESTDELQR